MKSLAFLSFAIMLVILATSLVFAKNDKSNGNNNNDDDDLNNGGTFADEAEAGFNMATLWRCYKKSNRKWSKSDDTTNWKDFVNNGVWKNDNAFKNWKRNKRGNAWTCNTKISKTTRAVTDAELNNGGTFATTTERDENLWKLYECFMAVRKNWNPNARSGFGSLADWVENGEWRESEDFRTWKEFHTGKFSKCFAAIPSTAAPTAKPTTTTTTTTKLPDVTPQGNPTTPAPVPMTFTTANPRGGNTFLDPGCDGLRNDAVKIDAWCRAKYGDQVASKFSDCELAQCGYVEIDPIRMGTVCIRSGTWDYVDAFGNTVNFDLDAVFNMNNVPRTPKPVGSPCGVQDLCNTPAATCNGIIRHCPNNNHFYVVNVNGACSYCGADTGSSFVAGEDLTVGNVAAPCQNAGTCNTFEALNFPECLSQCYGDSSLEIFVDGHCTNGNYQCDYRFVKHEGEDFTAGVCPWWIFVYDVSLTGGVQVAARVGKAQSEAEVKAALVADIARVTGVSAASVTIISFTQTGSNIAVTFSTTDNVADSSVKAALSSASAFTATGAAAGTSFTAAVVTRNTDALLQGHSASVVNNNGGTASNNNADVSASASAACGAGCVGGIAAGLVVAIGAIVVVVRRSTGSSEAAPVESEDATSNIPMKVKANETVTLDVRAEEEQDNQTEDVLAATTNPLSPVGASLAVDNKPQFQPIDDSVVDENME